MAESALCYAHERRNTAAPLAVPTAGVNERLQFSTAQTEEPDTGDSLLCLRCPGNGAECTAAGVTVVHPPPLPRRRGHMNLFVPPWTLTPRVGAAAVWGSLLRRCVTQSVSTAISALSGEGFVKQEARLREKRAFRFIEPHLLFVCEGCRLPLFLRHLLIVVTITTITNERFVQLFY